MSTACNNSYSGKTGENKTAFSEEQAKAEVGKSIAGMEAALANKDAKAAANFYTVDAVFMPFNAPVVTGRTNIETALAGFIDAGFTDLKVESTWAEHSGEYILETEKWTLGNGEVTMSGKSLIVWKKEDGAWKMYKDMISTDTP